MSAFREDAVGSEIRSSPFRAPESHESTLYIKLGGRQDVPLYIRLDDIPELETRGFFATQFAGSAYGVNLTKQAAGTIGYTTTGTLREAYYVHAEGSPSTVPGPQGVQGPYTVKIFRNAAATPATPSGGSYNIVSGSLIAPVGWSISPTTQGAGEETYISESIVNPAVQSGTIVPVLVGAVPRWRNWSKRRQRGQRRQGGSRGCWATRRGHCFP